MLYVGLALEMVQRLQLVQNGAARLLTEAYDLSPGYHKEHSSLYEASQLFNSSGESLLLSPLLSQAHLVWLPLGCGMPSLLSFW